MKRQGISNPIQSSPINTPPPPSNHLFLHVVTTNKRILRPQHLKSLLLPHHPNLPHSPLRTSALCTPPTLPKPSRDPLQPPPPTHPPHQRPQRRQHPSNHIRPGLRHRPTQRPHLLKREILKAPHREETLKPHHRRHHGRDAHAQHDRQACFRRRGNPELVQRGHRDADDHQRGDEVRDGQVFPEG